MKQVSPDYLLSMGFILRWFGLFLLVLMLVPSSVSALEGYTEGWLGSPEWVRDRMDTNILPDFFFPRDEDSESKELPTVTSHVKAGNDLLAGGAFLDAKRSFESAIALNPSSYEAWIGRGFAMEGLDRYQSALESYEKAISLSARKETAWAAYAGKGRMSLNLNQYADAEHAFERAITLFDQDPLGTSDDYQQLTEGLAEAKAKIGVSSAYSASPFTPKPEITIRSALPSSS